MILAYRFDNDYSCNIEKNIIYDPAGFQIADLTDTLRHFNLCLKEMSDTDVWLLCRPIILAHEQGMKQAEGQILKKIYKTFGLRGKE